MVLRKILNHPFLLTKDGNELSRYLQQFLLTNKMNVENKWEFSAKFQFLFNILTKIKSNNDIGEKIIIVSYFSQTLDMVEELCKSFGFKLVRLDGKVAATL